MKKDKEKVIDEVWTEDHIRGFLRFRPYDGSNEDFHVLLKAYRSMRVEDFEQFVQFFLEQGRDPDATGPGGKTVLQIIATHRHGGPYAGVLRAAGAQEAS